MDSRVTVMLHSVLDEEMEEICKGGVGKGRKAEMQADWTDRQMDKWAWPEQGKTKEAKRKKGRGRTGKRRGRRDDCGRACA